MEWVERLNQSIAYIEEHLTEEIDYAHPEVYIRNLWINGKRL